MPRTANPFPPLCFHKSAGQYYYRRDGRQVYLGTDRLAADARRIADLKAPPSTLPRSGSAVLVAEAVAEYLRDKVPTMDPRDQRRSRFALEAVVTLFGHRWIESFRLREAESVARHFASMPTINRETGERTARPLSPLYVRKLMGAVCQCWRWAMARDLVTSDSCAKVCQVLRELKPGPWKATATVPPDDFRKAVALLRPEVRAMALLHLLTGMRTGELLRISAAEIERTGAVWIYRPARHKNAGRGKSRAVYLDAECQRIIAPWLDFAPCFAMTLTGYSQAIRRACKKAGVPKWRPGQLRHASATEARIHAGDAAAIALLGHHSARLLATYTGEAEEIRRRRAG